MIYFFGEVYIQLFHAAGTLVGLAIGDAFGAPLEGLPSPGKRVREMGYSYQRNRKPGIFTDDTAQALAVATSLTRCRGYSQEDLMAELVAAYCSDPDVYGPTSRRVFELVLSGADYRVAARSVHEMNGGSRSNGSVMRGPPIGIFYSGPMVEACSLACSRLTHYDPVAGACSAFVNRMVSDLCRGRGKEQAYVRALSRCQNDEVYEMLGRYRWYDPVSGLDCLLATHAALTVFMQNDSFEETLVSAVGLGGDADTVGAIAGALSGSYYEIGAIPRRWLAGLQGLPRVTSVAWELWNVAMQ